MPRWEPRMISRAGNDRVRGLWRARPLGFGLRRRSAFTLIELLLVIVIIGVISAVAVPSYVQSMRGNRLRTAARTVVAAGRYARSMAVLHQRDVVLEFHLDQARLVIDTIRWVGQTNAVADVVEDELASDDPAGGVNSLAVGAESRDPRGGEANIRLERWLDGVALVGVRAADESSMMSAEGVVRVRYASNGRCEPYEVEIEDDQGGRVSIDVDMLGGAETESVL